MSRPELVQSIVFHALENLNEELPEGSKVPVGVDTPLLGKGAQLDSLTFVSFIIDVESGISDRFGHAVSLTDDRALSQEVSPFTNIGALVSYVLLLMGERD